jgi:hypothetical protein
VRAAVGQRWACSSVPGSLGPQRLMLRTGWCRERCPTGELQIGGAVVAGGSELKSDGDADGRVGRRSH